MMSLQRVIATGGIVLSLLSLAGGVVAAGPAPPPGADSFFRFDGTVTLGNLLTVLGFLLGLFGAYSRLMAKVASIETKTEAMWAWFVRNRYEP